MSTMRGIDPGQMTPPRVEAEIVRLCRRLEDENDLLAGMAQQYAQAQAAYKSTWARAVLEARALDAKAPMGLCEAHADVVAEDARFAAICAEELLKAKHEQCRSLRTQVSALQSLGANLRAELQNAGIGR